MQPLQIKDSDLNTKRMLDLMAVNQDDTTVPLYIHVVHRILRDMRIDQQSSGRAFDYNLFKTKIMDSDLTSTQLAPLSQRLSVLESFMPRRVGTHKAKDKVLGTKWTNEVSAKARSKGVFSLTRQQPGLLSIVDLSCPCISPETACSLFNACLSMFIEQDISCGRVVALDEAHKVSCLMH